jgi:2-dehydro-3-deoxygalactonokinase
MNAARFIAGDWGTSHLRLALCDGAGHVLAETTGPGAAACRGRFAEVYAQSIAPWSAHGPLPALLCGMAGSRQGWIEAPYLRCPADLEYLASCSIATDAQGPRIMPGLTCTNPLGVADFLRGEETQLVGALALDARLRAGRQLVVLPGTHSKWVQLDDGQVRQFQTVVTGEVYAALHAHGVLVTQAAPINDGPLDGAFMHGVERARTTSPASLLALLFECRSRRLAGELPEGEESTFLSGLLICHEIAHGLASVETPARICLVGASALARRYACALSVFGVEAYGLDGNHAAVAGLAAAWRQLHGEP